MILPLAIAFKLVDVGGGRHHDDGDRGEASEAEEGHDDVGGGDFHEWFV